MQFSMRQPSISLALNTKQPPPLLVHAGARARCRSGHLAVHAGSSRTGGHSRAALLAAANSRSIGEVVLAENTDQDSKPRVVKFYKVEMTVQECDLDNFEVVNNAVYASYLEKAREELLNSLGMSTASIAHTTGALALLNLHLKYYAPLRLGDRFVVNIRITKVKGLRFFAEHLIERLPDRKLAVEATATFVCLDKDYRPTRLFPEVFKLVELFASDDGELP